MKKPEPTKSATAVRGKYTNLLKQGSNVVIVDPTLMPHFPDSESVKRVPRHRRQRSGRRPASSSSEAYRAKNQHGL